MNNVVNENFFDSREQMFAVLVEDCRNALATAIALRQSATMLVSGGSTPKPLYQQLSSAALDWAKVQVALVDERWVNVDCVGSNEAFIRHNLLVNNAGQAQFTAMKSPAATAILGAQDIEQRYQQFSTPFDLTILGMGGDGHTASLFPYANGLSDALEIGSGNLCAAINAEPSEVTGDLTERISLSLFGLLQSRQLHLLITGEEKLEVYYQALANKEVSLMPVSAVLQQERVPVHVYWAP